LARVASSKHFKYGLPFFTFIFGGSFALSEFRSVRYDSKLNPKVAKFVKPEEAFGESELLKRKNIKYRNTEKEVSLEEELENLNKKIDLDNWENKRGPRVWEEDTIVKREKFRMKMSPPTVAELTEAGRL